VCKHINAHTCTSTQDVRGNTRIQKEKHCHAQTHTQRHVFKDSERENPVTHHTEGVQLSEPQGPPVTRDSQSSTPTLHTYMCLSLFLSFSLCLSLSPSLCIYLCVYDSLSITLSFTLTLYQFLSVCTSPLRPCPHYIG
jgi:hypothetical protein